MLACISIFSAINRLNQFCKLAERRKSNLNLWTFLLTFNIAVKLTQGTVLGNHLFHKKLNEHLSDKIYSLT